MKNELEPVVLAQAEERLRQEREIFDQKKGQDARHFLLRMTMGWTAVVLFIAICAFCGYIIVNANDFADGTVTAATTALLVEALGLIGFMWKGTVGSGPTELAPVTGAPQEQNATSNERQELSAATDNE